MRELLIEQLLSAVVKYHCRKGIRHNCDCDYCAEKQWATYTMAFQYWLPGVPNLPKPDWNDPWDVRDYLKAKRAQALVKMIRPRLMRAREILQYPQQQQEKVST